MTEWILVANRRYRAYEALRDLGRIEWLKIAKLKNAAAGDTVYVYQCAPVKAIRWKCRITDADRTALRIDDSAYSDGPAVYTGPWIEIEAVFEFPVFTRLSLRELRNHGYRGNMQGPSPAASYPGLSDYLHETEREQASEQGLAALLDAASLGELKKLAIAHAREKPAVSRSWSAQYARSPVISRYAKERAGGFCQLCGQKAPFDDRRGFPYLETHHVRWLSRGGADAMENVAALCPNCHRRMHVLQDPADVNALRKVLEKP